jgi:hypothetical protein
LLKQGGNVQSRETTPEPLELTVDSIYDKALIIRPRLPLIDGIFDVRADTLIASHTPHSRIPEHLHDHLPHMHIRYGFEIPPQSLAGIDAAALEVAMLVQVAHRVDCNPIFVARGPSSTGICLKIANQDVHWVHNDDVGRKATELFEATGRQVPEGYYFSGFQTSDVEERRVWRYSREDLLRAIGRGVRADQHFQATWREPREDFISPYDVIICLSDDATSFHTFFRLRPTVSLGAF